MPDFNPNDMDALFREGAERHEFEYNPNSWALMEEKLDKKENKRKILFYLLGLALLIGAIVTYSSIQFNNSDAEKQAVASTKKITKTNKVQDELKNIDNNGAEMVNEEAAVSNNQQEIQEEYISTDSKESGRNIGAQNSFQSENTGNLIGNEIVSINSQDQTLQNEPKIQNEVVNDNDFETKTIQIPESQKSNLGKENLFIPFLKERNIDLLDSQLRDLDMANLGFTRPVSRPDLQASSNRFALTLFANPEWSSVGLFKDSKAGWSVGTRFGYQFADKFEISAGLAYSRKIYKGAGVEYSMDGGWYLDIAPMSMDAKCDVIEIPIGFSYYINGFRNNGFFVDLGMSSYMLHSEWYGFNYEHALVSRPERYKEVIEEDENTHLVGVGRFAIGYQKVLSNKTSVQIAPYLQFPLTGIGAGQVNLYSSGVQIAVKFNTQ